MGMTGRVRKYLTKEDKERIREQERAGIPAWKIADMYDISEFAVRKICGLNMD